MYSLGTTGRNTKIHSKIPTLLANIISASPNNKISTVADVLAAPDTQQVIDVSLHDSLLAWSKLLLHRCRWRMVFQKPGITARQVADKGPSSVSCLR